MGKRLRRRQREAVVRKQPNESRSAFHKRLRRSLAPKEHA